MPDRPKPKKNKNVNYPKFVIIIQQIYAFPTGKTANLQRIYQNTKQNLSKLVTFFIFDYICMSKIP